MTGGHAPKNESVVHPEPMSLDLHKNDRTNSEPGPLGLHPGTQQHPGSAEGGRWSGRWGSVRTTPPDAMMIWQAVREVEVTGN